MDAVQEMCVELEKEVAGFNDQLKQRDSKITQLEKVTQFTHTYILYQYCNDTCIVLCAY